MKLETYLLYSIRGYAKTRFVIVHVRSTDTNALGQVVTIVLEQVVTTVTTLGWLAPLARTESGVLTKAEGTKLN